MDVCWWQLTYLNRLKYIIILTNINYLHMYMNLKVVVFAEFKSQLFLHKNKRTKLPDSIKTTNFHRLR